MEEGRLPEQLLVYRKACIDKTPTDPLKLKSHHIQYDESQHVIPGSAALSVSPSGDMTSYMTMMNISHSQRQSHLSSP